MDVPPRWQTLSGVKGGGEGGVSTVLPHPPHLLSLTLSLLLPHLTLSSYLFSDTAAYTYLVSLKETFPSNLAFKKVFWLQNSFLLQKSFFLISGI